MRLSILIFSIVYITSTNARSNNLSNPTVTLLSSLSSSSSSSSSSASPLIQHIAKEDGTNTQTKEQTKDLPAEFQSAYEYVPITALDQYGQSTQLRHAQLASSRYGALTLAAMATLPPSSSTSSSTSSHDNQEEETVIVCATLPNQSSAGLKSKSSTLLQIVAFDTSSSAHNPKDQSIVAMMGSGIKPDVQFVTSHIRDYSRRIWERYDVIPTSHRLSRAVSELCRSFMGYDISEEIMDGVGPVLLQSDGEEDENSEPMARPLGVQMLIMGIHKQQAVDMVSVDAAGVQTPCYYWAMGRDGDEAYKLLQERWEEGITVEELKKVMTKICKDIRFADKDNNLQENNILSFETLSGKGISLSQTKILS